MARLDSTQLVYVVSVALHVVGGLALAAVNVPEPEALQIIEMQTVELPKPPKPPPPPDTPEVTQQAAPRPRSAPTPTPEAAPTPPPDFGFALGAADGAGGIAIAAPTPKVAAPAVRQASKQLAAIKVVPEAGCDAPATKAKATAMPRPAYTDEARAAAIEGKVRVELTVDAAGAVTDAKVLEGLGHGLDEAALAAVRTATFTPATECGKPVGATFTVAVRFSL